MGRRSLVVVVVNPFSTKLPSDTALKTFDHTVESRNSDLLLTPTYVTASCTVVFAISLSSMSCLMANLFVLCSSAVRSKAILSFADFC